MTGSMGEGLGEEKLFDTFKPIPDVRFDHRHFHALAFLAVYRYSIFLFCVCFFSSSQHKSEALPSHVSEKGK
jgi:hypothetical protein